SVLSPRSSSRAPATPRSAARAAPATVARACSGGSARVFVTTCTLRLPASARAIRSGWRQASRTRMPKSVCAPVGSSSSTTRRSTNGRGGEERRSGSAIISSYGRTGCRRGDEPALASRRAGSARQEAGHRVHVLGAVELRALDAHAVRVRCRDERRHATAAVPQRDVRAGVAQRGRGGGDVVHAEADVVQPLAVLL